jgi:hypothetical protein
MAKAEQNVTNPNVKFLTVPEAQALADRLFSRSKSTLFVASPEVRRDLCIASRAIRTLRHEVDRMASRCEDHAHLLRALQIDVGECRHGRPHQAPRRHRRRLHP